MNLLSDEQYELLAFIAACNRNSYKPTAKEVMLWWENPEPREAEYRTVTVPSVFDPFLTGAKTAGLFADLRPGADSLAKMFGTMVADQSRWLSAAYEARTRRELRGDLGRRRSRRTHA